MELSSFFAPRISGGKNNNATSGSGSRDKNTDLVPPMIHHVCRPPKQLPPLASGASWKSKIRFLTPNKSSWVLHVPRFCCSPRSSMSKPTTTTASFREFWKARPNQQHSLVLFGRKVLENRYSAMYSTTKSVGNYTYSGSSRPCKVCDPGQQPHEKFVLDLCASADAIARQLFLLRTQNGKQTHETTTDTEKNDASLTTPQPATPIYNACLVNWYTPEHTIGLHSDDEPELDTSRPIFSLSWGGPRRFLLRPKTKSSSASGAHKPTKVLHEFVLKDGDLLVMGGKCQDEFKHEIPKVRSTKDGVVGNRISWTIRRMRPAKTKLYNKSTASQISGGRETEKHHPHEKKSGATKRTHEETSKSSSSNDPRPVIQPPNKPRKKAIIYNPYTRSRA